MEKTRILIVEDDESFLSLLEKVLVRSGYDVNTASSKNSFIKTISENSFDIIILDFILSDGNAMDYISEIKKIDLSVPFIIISGFANIDMTIDVMKAGAKDVLLKDHSLLENLPQKIDRYVSLSAKGKEDSISSGDFEKMLTLIYKHSPFALILTDRELNIRLWNNAATRLFGWNYNDLMGKTLPFNFKTDDNEDFQDNLKNFNSEKIFSQIEALVEVKTGDKKSIHFTVTPVKFSALLNGFLIIAEDVGEKRKTEQELLKSQDNYRILAENISDVIWILDKDMNFKYISPSVSDLSGYTVDEFMEKGIFDKIYDNDNRIKVREMFDLQKKSEEFKSPDHLYHQTEMADKNGRKLWLEHRFKPSYDDEGNIINFIGVTRDITERKQSQLEKDEINEHLRSLQRREIIGALSGGIAHDFNNLLTIIQGNVDIFMRKNSENIDPENVYIANINEALSRASTLTRQLLIFGKNRPLQLLKVNINNLIKNLEKMLSRVIRENITLTFRYNETESFFIADQGHLEQIIINLILNSSESIEECGEIVIETGIIKKDSSSDAYADNCIYLKVKDNGCGIKEEDKDKVFDPFYTTKEDKGASGLGLAVVKDLVKKYDGCIDFASSEKGTEFTVCFPEAADENSGTDKTFIDSSLQKESSSGENDLLVVEDDKNLSKTVSMILTDSGWNFDLAETVQDALKLYRKNKGRYNILFADIVLPDGSGLDLAKEIRKENKDIKILLSSGYPQHRTGWAEIEESSFSFLKKPYRMMELLRVLREL